MEFEEMSKLCKLAVQIFVNGVEPLLELFFCKLADWDMCGIMINVW